MSWRIGVISPTRKLNAQFVAVDMDTPFARKVKGMICKGQTINTRRQETAISTYLRGIQPRYRAPAIAEGGIEHNNADNDGFGRLRHIYVHPPSCSR
jgi:hypothetical protein